MSLSEIHCLVDKIEQLQKRIAELEADLRLSEKTADQLAERVAQLERRWNDILEVKAQAKRLRDAAWGKTLGGDGE